MTGKLNLSDFQNFKKDLFPENDFYLLADEDKIFEIKKKKFKSNNSISRLAAFAILGRPRTCVPGFIAFVLGFNYANNNNPASFKFILGAVLSFLIGFSANLHNSYTDLYEDVINTPRRIFLLGKFGYRTLFYLLFVIDVGMIAASSFLGYYFFIFMLLAVCGLQQYSFPPYRTKSKPIIGLWVFSQAVVFPFIFGCALLADNLKLVLLPPIFFKPFNTSGVENIYSLLTELKNAFIPPALLSFKINTFSYSLFHMGQRYYGMYFFLTLWFIAKGLYKNVPDYECDKKAGLETSATLFYSQKSASYFASAFTIISYLSISLLVVLNLESNKLMYSLLWIIPAFWSCYKLINSKSFAESNLCLKNDMIITIGFISTVLLLIFPCFLNLIIVFGGILTISLSDWLNVDSRKNI